jgi:hypothetical protein
MDGNIFCVDLTRGKLHGIPNVKGTLQKSDSGVGLSLVFNEYNNGQYGTPGSAILCTSQGDGHVSYISSCFPQPIIE